MASLKNDEGEWVDEAEILKEMGLSFFQKLYTPEDGVIPVDFTNLPSPCISMAQKQELALPIVDEEVWAAIRGMGPLKAPGPDGFQAIFYQKE